MKSGGRSCRALCAIALLAALASCAPPSADSVYFGKADPPEGRTLRYIPGPEPQSLDPHVGIGLVEMRIYQALFEGLVLYHPKTMAPIPGIAERWEASDDFTRFTFHLRENARFSNGDPITADDFVWSLRRALDPKLAARYAYIAYPILNAEGYNAGGSFVRDAGTGQLDLDPATGARRFVAPGSAPEPGKELVPIRAEDVGVEALDPGTVRYTLTQPSPYFVGMLALGFFMVVHRATIEKHGNEAWALPENIVTSGSFHLKQWKPYERIVVVENSMHWDAASVRLEEIRFYPAEDTTTMMNLYKAGVVDALPEHSVPAPWVDLVRPLEDFMDAPEMGTFYLNVNTTRPPMDDVRVRKAFSLSLDREALARFRRVAIPLHGFVPDGVFPGYPVVKGDEYDPARARALLAEAGYRDAAGSFDPARFPIDEVEYLYPAGDQERRVAELLQAQWKQSLGLTVPLRAMELRAMADYRGLRWGMWYGDYADPYTFLSLFLTPTASNPTGWWEKSYVDKLDDANRTRDPAERLRKMASAEQQLVSSGAVIPLWTWSSAWMKKPYVKGMYPNPSSMFAWKFVYIEHDRARWNDPPPEVGY